MKKNLFLVCTLVAILVVNVLNATTVMAQTTETTETTKEVKRQLTDSELDEYKTILNLTNSVVYNPEYTYVYEALYPSITKRIRSLLTNAENSFHEYENTKDLNELKRSATYLYDTLDDIRAGYTVYTVVYNDTALNTKYKGLAGCINRVLEILSYL